MVIKIDILWFFIITLVLWFLSGLESDAPDFKAMDKKLDLIINNLTR
jgi:hypothetical protein